MKYASFKCAKLDGSSQNYWYREGEEVNGKVKNTPANSKNPFSKNGQFSEVLEFHKYPREFEKVLKKRPKQANFEIRNINFRSDKIKN